MLILAIDTALDACAAAVLDTGTAKLIAMESQAMKRGHAEALMPLIARVMKESGLPFAALDRVAVTTGPGSFTGLRVGVSAARGIALAANKPAVGLTTLTAFAAPHIATDDVTPLMAVIDARNNNVFMQLFGPGGRSLMSPRLTALDDAVRTAMLGPARIVGSAANSVAAAWPASQPLPPLVDAQSAPNIEWVARLGAAAIADDTAVPKPLYLRAPDAQPQDAARLPRR
jgi:tRNA threonylcarbamoyladenosine biosynthesis protein TsaB